MHLLLDNMYYILYSLRYVKPASGNVNVITLHYVNFSVVDCK